MKPLLASVIFVAVFANAYAVIAKTEPLAGSIQSESTSIPATPSLSYPIALEARVIQQSGKIHSLLIAEVQPGSEAASAGLIPRDEIIKINGRAISDMGQSHLETELPALLMNRPPGEALRLEVLTKRTKAVTLVATSTQIRPSNIKPTNIQPTKEERYQLEPFRVSGTPVTSFPIELQVHVSKETRLVTSVIITDVVPGIDPDLTDLKAGDEIIKINGRPVAGMDGKTQLQSDLAALLINRPYGEKLQLEVISQRIQPITLHAAASPAIR